MTSPRQRKFNQGITLVELLVVCSIMGILTMSLLVQYRDYDSKVLLRNLAYEIAVTVREAQISSISALGNRQGGSVNIFNDSYGMYFTAGATQYILFTDANNNGVYDAGASELVRTYAIGGSKRIKQNTNSTENGICTVMSGVSTCTARASVSVTFKRPHLYAQIIDTGTCSTSSCSNAREEVRIKVESTVKPTSATNNERILSITRAGRISID